MSIRLPTAFSARPVLVFIAFLLLCVFGIITTAQVAPTASPVVMPFIKLFILFPSLFIFVTVLVCPKSGKVARYVVEEEKKYEKIFIAYNGCADDL